MTSTAPETWSAPERPEAAEPPRPTGVRAWPAWIGPTGVVAAIIATTILGLVIAVAAELAGASVFDSPEDSPPGVLIAGGLLQGFVFVATAVLFARIAGPVAPADLGLRRTAFWRAVGITIGLYVCFAILAAVWAQLVGLPGDEDLLDSLGIDRSALLLVLGAITVCVAAPIGEEILFRGLLYGALRNRLGIAGAAIATGVAFGAIHGFSSPPEHLVPLAIFGAGLCLIYQLTGSLYPCIALHAINNSIAFGANEDWTWEILVLTVSAVAVCFALAMLAARAWPRRLGARPVA